MTEAQMEKIVDRMVWQRLSTDMEYSFAENAEAQAAREDRIAAQCWAEAEEKYGLPV